MALDILIVQHADKIRLPGNHGLTELGLSQAKARGESLRDAGSFEEIWCSNLLRSRETAELVAETIGIDREAIQEDARIAERINWWSEDELSLEMFRAEWERSTVDRDYEPPYGDSSHVAGDRFAAFLTDLHARKPDGHVLVVSHGGVTIDLCRTWFGDERVRELAPNAIEDGIPACAIMHINLDRNGKTLHRLGDTSPA